MALAFLLFGGEIMEIWKDVVGYEGFYQVSDHGNVRSVERHVTHSKGSIALKKSVALKPQPNLSGHLRVPLWNVTSKYKYVHRLVLEAFISARPDKMESCHNDGDSSNDRLDNLRWDTHKSNIADKLSHGTIQRGETGNGAKLSESKVIEILQRIRDNEVGCHLTTEYGVTPATISRVKLGQTWSHVHV